MAMRTKRGIAAAASTVVLIVGGAAAVTAAPAAAGPLPACKKDIVHGAWIETLCSVHDSQAQCEAAKAARGGVYEFFAVTRKGVELIRYHLTCIGPDGGASSTAVVGGTTDGLWHLSHIGP